MFVRVKRAIFVAFLGLTLVACDEAVTKEDAIVVNDNIEEVVDIKEDIIDELEEDVASLDNKDEYLDALSIPTSYVDNNLENASIIMDMYFDNKDIAYTKEFKDKLDEIILGVSDNVRQVKEIGDVPMDYTESHELIIKSIEAYLNGLVSFQQGVVTNDDKYFHAIDGFYDEAHDYMMEAQEIMMSSELEA